jgi:hypothetical protein
LVTGVLYLALLPIHLRTNLQNDVVRRAYLAVWPAVSLRAFGYVVVALRYTGVLVFVVVAGLIVWRRPRDLLALVVALMLITLPLMFQLAGYSDSWLPYPPAWRPVLNAAHKAVTMGVGAPALLAFCFLFPTGRAEPRWLGWAGASLSLLLYVGVISSTLLPALATVDWLFGLLVINLGLVLLLALVGQAYRYLRVSSPTERQQTGMVVLGLFAFVFGLLAQLIISMLAERRSLDPWVSVGALLLALLTVTTLPLSLAVAILRYHLWDIDVIVRRTLIYGLLTTLLALAYFGAVVLLQAVVRPFTGQSENPLVSVLSTLLIAALFGPLRRRVQAFIDRRFYRRKYDAARIIALFGEALRDETALDQVTARLEYVAAATVQPSHASVWLPAAPVPRPPGGADHA